jgi:hypothetical protein
MDLIMGVVFDVESRLSPPRLYEHIGGERLLDRIDLAEFHEHYPDVDGSLRHKLIDKTSSTANYVTRTTIVSVQPFS